MNLLAAFMDIAKDWAGVFPQRRTFERATRQAIGTLICMGRRTLSTVSCQLDAGAALSAGFFAGAFV